MGVQLGFYGVQLGGKVIWAGSRGLRLRCGNFRAAAGGCHHACQTMERCGADAAVRSWPAARFRLTAIIVSAARRPAPGRRLLHPEHRPHGPRAHRTGTRPTGTRTLHRLASTTHPRRRATRQLGPRQQRHPLPAHRFLTSADMASPGGTSRDAGQPRAGRRLSTRG